MKNSKAPPKEQTEYPETMSKSLMHLMYDKGPS